MSEELESRLAAVEGLAGPVRDGPGQGRGRDRDARRDRPFRRRQRAGLERQVRAATIAMPGVTDTRVAMTAEKMQRTIIAIGSGKGGVGKSTVSANIAVALARMGKKVGLIDADIYGPSQPRIMGNASRPELIDQQIVPVPTHGVRMLSIGQLIEPGTAVAWRGPMTASALTSLMDGDWGDCELLIVDLPPGTGDVQMTLIQKWKPAGAVIVSTPQDLSLMDATRAIDMFRKMDVQGDRPGREYGRLCLPALRRGQRSVRKRRARKRRPA